MSIWELQTVSIIYLRLEHNGQESVDAEGLLSLKM